MRLDELSTEIGELLDPESGVLEVDHITHDSHKVHAGSAFVALKGIHKDGHNYIGCAIQLGAVCIVTPYPDKVTCSLPIIKVANARRAMAQLARRLYRQPDKKIKVIGITGTNGKTTSTYLIG